MKNINFAVPDINQDDIDAVNAVLRSGWITSGGVGVFIRAWGEQVSLTQTIFSKYPQ